MSFVKGLFSGFRFKTKLMLLSLCMLIVPILLFSYYSYGAIKHNIIIEQRESISSESKVLRDFVQENFHWVLSDSIVPLQSIRKTNEEQLEILKMGLSMARSYEDDDLLRIVQDYLLTAGNSDHISLFISKIKDPKRGGFATEEIKDLLDSVMASNTSLTLEKLIRTKTFTKGKYYHFHFVYENRHYLVTITLLDKNNVICMLHDITLIRDNYHETSIEKAFALDVVSLIGAINRVDPNSTSIYVFTEELKSIIKKSNFQLPELVTHDLLEKAKTNEFWEGYLDEMNYAYIFYFRQTGWFFLYTINLEESIVSLKDSMSIIWIISAFLAISCIFMCSFILRRPMRTLTSIAKTAEYIEKADLTNKDELEIILRMLPEHSNDEIGLLAKTLREMASSISDNAIKLLSANAQKRQLEGELNAAKDIQKGILPVSLSSPEYDPLKIYGLLVPAKEVGGDLYDVISVDEDNVALIIGDVSDKGVPASLVMAMSVILIRECISLNMSVQQVAMELNKAMCMHNPNMMFVTLFVGILNKTSREFSYVNCGHCVPYIVKDKKVSLLEGLSGPAIGVAPDFEYKFFKQTLPPSCNLFLYTDGVSEAQNQNQELYGEERISSFLERLSTDDPYRMCSKMMDDIILYRNNAPQSDDITMLNVKI